MALLIEKHICIVPVFDLQDVADERVGSKRVCKVSLRLLEALLLGSALRWRSEILAEIVP